jgi:hypothetical protein
MVKRTQLDCPLRGELALPVTAPFLLGYKASPELTFLGGRVSPAEIAALITGVGLAPVPGKAE